MNLCGNTLANAAPRQLLCNIYIFTFRTDLFHNYDNFTDAIPVMASYKVSNVSRLRGFHSISFRIICIVATGIEARGVSPLLRKKWCSRPVDEGPCAVVWGAGEAKQRTRVREHKQTMRFDTVITVPLCFLQFPATPRWRSGTRRGWRWIYASGNCGAPSACRAAGRREYRLARKASDAAATRAATMRKLCLLFVYAELSCAF